MPEPKTPPAGRSLGSGVPGAGGPDGPAPEAEGRILAIAHAMNDALAAVVANVTLALEAAGDPLADPASALASVKEPLLDAQQGAERLRALVKSLRAAAAPSGSTQASVMPKQDFDAVEEGTGRRARNTRILVVDDEEMIGRALRKSLWQYDVQVLEDAREALAKIRAGERFEVLVCDLMMPQMSGVDLYEEILRIAPAQAANMVFITGGALTTRTRQFVSTVPNPVIAKPFDVNKLRDLVRQRIPTPSQPDRVVLVVDDDADARALVVRWLTKANFRCIEQASGAAAIETLAADPAAVDAVILDVMMPGMDGFEVVAALKAEAATANVPVILLTAHALGEADMAHGIELGAADYLTKPFSGPVLTAKVRAACERSQAERDVQARLHFAEEHATTDGLTGLMNRRAFDARLAECTATSTRHGEPLALVLLDVDHFKQINDTFGHAGGDEVLLYLARAMRRAVRVEDQTFRYGGEEFALLLPKCGAEGASSLVARIQTDLRQRPVTLADGRSVVVRFSAGVASAEAVNGFRVEDMVRRADAALYRAKSEGRDRVVREPG